MSFLKKKKNDFWAQPYLRNEELNKIKWVTLESLKTINTVMYFADLQEKMNMWHCSQLRRHFIKKVCCN